jgi:hypothetical protein
MANLCQDPKGPKYRSHGGPVRDIMEWVRRSDSPYVSAPLEIDGKTIGRFASTELNRRAWLFSSCRAPFWVGGLFPSVAGRKLVVNYIVLEHVSSPYSWYAFISGVGEPDDLVRELDRFVGRELYDVDVDVVAGLLVQVPAPTLVSGHFWTIVFRPHRDDVYGGPPPDSVDLSRHGSAVDGVDVGVGGVHCSYLLSPLVGVPLPVHSRTDVGGVGELEAGDRILSDPPDLWPLTCEGGSGGSQSRPSSVGMLIVV